jgi:hypothetical protein
MYEKYGKELRDIQAMRQRLLKQRRDDLVILCICRGSLCSEARLLLKPEHFSLPDEKPHRMIIRHLWRLLDGNLYAPGQVPYAALYDALAAEFVTLKPAELDEPWVGETINDPTQAGWEGAEPGLLWQAWRNASSSTPWRGSSPRPPGPACRSITRHSSPPSSRRPGGSNPSGPARSGCRCRRAGCRPR